MSVKAGEAQIRRPRDKADLRRMVVESMVKAGSQQQLKRAIVIHMHGLSKQPKRIRSVFRHHRFRYAA